MQLFFLVYGGFGANLLEVQCKNGSAGRGGLVCVLVIALFELVLPA